MKRIASVLALVLAMLVAMPVSAAENTFRDVPQNHWAYDFVEQAAQEGWVTGVGGGRYEPESKITGAEFLTMITKSLYPEEIGLGEPGEPWYQPYVNTAEAHGMLTHGLGEKEVLDNPVNRYRMAAVLCSVAKETGVVEYENGGILAADGITVMNDSNASNYIGDWASVPEEYREAVMVSYALGLLSGNDSKGTFGGASSMNRAESAVVLCRINDLVRNGTAIQQYSARVVELVNEERAKEGLGALRVDDTLQKAAQARAGELVQQFSHTRPDGTSCFTVLNEYGVSGYSSAGENIAMGYATPEAVMIGWMNSPGHRANILTPSFDTIAVGCVEYNGVFYWVQLFLG